MKKILLIFTLLTGFVFMQDECSEITNPYECYALGCEWITSYEQVGNELIITEECFGHNDWEDECRYFESEDECIAADCEWNDENGCSSSWDNNEDENDNENYCEGLTEDECFEAEGCQWYDGEGCYRSEDDNDGDDDWNDNEDENYWECMSDCEGYGDIEEDDFCSWLLEVFPTGCGYDCNQNILDQIEELMIQCDESNNDDSDNDWDDNENYCEGLTEDECWEAEGCQWYDGEGCYRSDDEDNQFDSCSDIENLEECENVDGCEWMYSNNMPGYGSCIDSEWENDDCNPDLACATVLTCYEDLLYPTSCGPENCDEPIGECEEDNEDGCFEDGEWYCIGCELFINDCEYLECTLNGWGGPYTLDNDECFNNDWECSDLGYEDCVEVDYCEWSSYVTPNGFFEGCIDIENDNDGPPECLMDCPGIEYILPTEENPYEACDWIISNFGPNNFFNECAYDCDEQTMMEIYEIVEACYECLENSDMDCSDIFNDNDDENNCFDLGYEECLENPNCQPNYNAAGQFEGCGYYDDQLGFGFLFGRVEFIYGDAIDFVSYATLHVESLPSNSDMVYFEVMTDAEGYYQIDLPVGAYVVTAFANEESLTQDIFITADNEHELNFLLGDWGGPWEPFAHLSLGAASGSPGADVVMPLYLSSSDFVGGVQFTIQPGIANSLMTEAIDSLDPCFEANFNTLDDGQVIGIIFSLEGCSYPPEEMLHIADLVFTINDSFQNGNIIELFFNNTIVSDSNGNEIPSYGEGNIITVGLLGDINGDFEINVLDVVIVINFALYIDEPSDSEFWASDINFDGMINVLDIVQLVNVILD